MNKHRTCGYSLLTHCSFDATKNKLDYYRGEECIKNFSKDLKKHVPEVINHEEKKNDVINKHRQ